METGFYKNIEKKFNDNVHYLIKGIPHFLKDNYLFYVYFVHFYGCFALFILEQLPMIHTICIAQHFITT